MLSDGAIKDALLDGSLAIQPFDIERIGANSYDIEIERIFRVKLPKFRRNTRDAAKMAKARYARRAFVDRFIPRIGIEQFIDQKCGKYEGVMEPDDLYIGMSREKIYSGRPFDITTRSSPARKGVELVPQLKPFKPENQTPQHAYFFMRTMDTTCEVPEGRRLSQLVVDPTKPASQEDLKDMLKRGKLQIESDRLSIEANPREPWLSYAQLHENSLILRLGRVLKRYNGKPMSIDTEDDSCFEKIDLRDFRDKRERDYELRPGQFYLGESYEAVGLPDDYAGMLKTIYEPWLRANFNSYAPLINGGAPLHCIVYEFNTPGVIRVSEWLPICGLDLHFLGQAAELPYTKTGRYIGQKGVQTSLAHNGL